MTTEVEVARVGETLARAARRMRDLNVGFLPVCTGDGGVVGIVTDRDIVVRALAEDRSGTDLVEEIMTEQVITCLPRDDVRRAEELMRVNLKSRLPVVDDDGRLMGVISLADIAQYESPQRTGELLSDISDREVR